LSPIHAADPSLRTALILTSLSHDGMIYGAYYMGAVFWQMPQNIGYDYDSAHFWAYWDAGVALYGKLVSGTLAVVLPLSYINAMVDIAKKIIKSVLR
jgi:hypothetical protein